MELVTEQLSCLVSTRPVFSSPLLRSARYLPRLPFEVGGGVRGLSAKLEAVRGLSAKYEGPWFKWDV